MTAISFRSWASRMDEAFEFCDKYVVNVTKRTNGELRLELLTSREGAIVLVYQTIGIVGGEGLKGLLCDDFDGDPGYARTISAFHQIGSARAGSILTEALALWNSVDHSRLQDDDFVLYDDYLADRYPEIHRRLRELEDEFEGLESDTIKRLAAFIQGYQPSSV